jgi:hypothetical protein
MNWRIDVSALVAFGCVVLATGVVSAGLVAVLPGMVPQDEASTVYRASPVDAPTTDDSTTVRHVSELPFTPERTAQRLIAGGVERDEGWLQGVEYLKDGEQYYEISTTTTEGVGPAWRGANMIAVVFGLVGVILVSTGSRIYHSLSATPR